MNRKRRTIVALLAVVAVLIAMWVLRGYFSQLVVRTSQPIAVMDTECELTVVFPRSSSYLFDRTFRAAEAVLRDVELHMSIYISATELSALNAAGAGETVKLSPQTMELLRTSRELTALTGGAFDVTCRPILQAWKNARPTKRFPTSKQLAEAKRRTGWEHFELLDGAVRKRIDGASIDLGGIAKGYAIDRATETMIDAGAIGGIVNVGGDMRCFGSGEDRRPWEIGVRSPFDDTLIATLRVYERSVCTSGNYQRFIEIDGKRYSHIADPRTSLAAEMTPSVTVVAPSATVADAWATALSVLGTDGLKLIPAHSRIEAAVITGTPEDYEFRITGGFEKFFAAPPKVKVIVHSAAKSQIFTTKSKN